MSVQQDQEASIPQETSCDITASHHTGHVILCGCGCSWKLIRTPRPSIICEYMNCLCGATLMSWCEAADYRFEALGCQED